MSAGLVPRLAALFGLLLAGFWLATEFVALPWVVSGESMEPGLSHGDRILVDLWTYRHRAPRPGEVVLLHAPLPGRPLLVKRATVPPVDAPAEAADRIWVLGDHAAASTDSRQFGAVPRADVRGRVVLRYWPPDKAEFL